MSRAVPTSDFSILMTTLSLLVALLEKGVLRAGRVPHNLIRGLSKYFMLEIGLGLTH